MAWEDTKNRMVGDNGEEHAGLASYGEAMYGQGGAAERRGAEREFTAGAVEDQANKLRMELGQLEGSLAAIEASLEAIVAQIQSGERVAHESKSVTAKELNQKLAVEAQTVKLQLLDEKNTLLTKRRMLEAKLADL